MPLDAGQSLPRPGAPSSPSGGALAGATLNQAAHREVGLPRGRPWAWESEAGAVAQVCGVAATAIVPGGIRQRHSWPDVGSHGPGPVPVRGMAWRPPAPHRHDKGFCRQPATAGPSLRSWPRGSILLGHGMALGDAFYADYLEGWTNLTIIIGWGVGCGEWVGPEIVACVICRRRHSPLVCRPGCQRCAQELL